MYYDSTFIILIPALLISVYAQFKVSSTFNKYSEVKSNQGYSGAQVARMLLDASGLYHIPVELVNGRLSDHYDPKNKVMRLSHDVYYGTSVASIGVAAHETGHAIQHKENYAPLGFRTAIVPLVNFSSNASWIIFILGFVLGIGGFISLGIILFSAVVIFQIVTLPVEFNASSRALTILETRGILYGDELKGAKSVLSAAALTYVAAALMSISQLIRLLIMSERRR